MTIIQRSVVVNTVVRPFVAALAIGLLLWTACAALSSRDRFRIDLRVPPTGAESQRPAHHAPTLPLAALDANGDGTPDVTLRQSGSDHGAPLVARQTTGPTAARRLTGRQLTPLHNPPR